MPPMLGSIEEFLGLRVEIHDVVYMPHLDAPPEKPHPFAYFISIHNESPQSITIRGRKWVVTESDRDITVVEGEGVVGQMPTIASGSHFSYHSYHIVRTNAQVTGAFFGHTQSGHRIYTRIPTFNLTIPADA